MVLLSSAPHAAWSQVTKIMPLGDSITRGTLDVNFPNGDIPGGYRKTLGIRLSGAALPYDLVGARNDNPASGMDPDHYGINGIRTDEVLGTLPNYLAYQPDKVIMLLGTNDILQLIPVQTIAENLDSLIIGLTHETPARRLYVGTLPAITGKSWSGKTAAYLNARADEYNTEVRSIVNLHALAGRNVMLVDLADRIVYNAPNDPLSNYYQPGDGVHPGQAGYDQLAEIWFHSIHSTYDAWASKHPQFLQLSTAEKLPSADPDEDGITNLLAYALAADPLSGSTEALLPTLTRTANSIIYQFRRNKDTQDLTYEILVSPDITVDDWDVIGQEAAKVENLGGDGTVEKVTVTIPDDPAADRRFIRLRVTK